MSTYGSGTYGSGTYGDPVPSAPGLPTTRRSLPVVVVQLTIDGVTSYFSDVEYGAPDERGAGTNWYDARVVGDIATIPAEPEATPPYASVDEYVQAALERVADSWVETTHVDQITVADFILRFTPEEYASITSSVDAQVLAVLGHLRIRATPQIRRSYQWNRIPCECGIPNIRARRCSS